jgi:methylenetetrahydrofolate dehydrogenase (NADP+)/methenyltetrahydrofolate cyclohydrolase
VISATGVAGLIKGNWIKPGAIVIDVGIERQIDGSLRGDVDFDSVIKVASWLTPVPGGVGPMTRASILENVLEAAEKVAP